MERLDYDQIWIDEVGNVIGLGSGDGPFLSYYAALDEVGWTEIALLLEAMETEGRRQLRDAVLSGELTVQVLCEMRYREQAHELEVARPPGPYADDTAATLRERFEEVYKARYHRTVPGVPLEILTWGVRVSGPLPEPPLPTVA